MGCAGTKTQSFSETSFTINQPQSQPNPKSTTTTTTTAFPPHEKASSRPHFEVGLTEREEESPLTAPSSPQCKKDQTPWTAVVVNSKENVVTSSTSSSTTSSSPKNGILLPQALLSQFTPLKPLGGGKFGTVILVRGVESNTPNEYTAIKIVPLKDLTVKDIQHLRSEVQSLNLCRHFFIVNLKSVHQEQDAMYLMTEYAPLGDLSRQISSNKRKNMFFKERDVLIILAMLFLALDYIHRCGLLHRDLKPSNIFFGDGGVLKLGDFGMSKLWENADAGQMAPGTLCGTPSYVAPEKWRGQKHNQASDLWALGTILFELMTLEKAFRGDSVSDVGSKIATGSVPSLKDTETRFSCALRQLCTDLLHPDPNMRPSISSILTREMFHEPLVAVQNTLTLMLDMDPSCHGAPQKDDILRMKTTLSQLNTFVRSNATNFQ